MFQYDHTGIWDLQCTCPELTSAFWTEDKLYQNDWYLSFESVPEKTDISNNIGCTGNYTHSNTY